MTDGSVIGMFREAVRAGPGRPAILSIHDGESSTTTYGQLERAVVATAAALERIGLVRGDRLVLYDDELVPSVERYLASLHLGLVPVLISPLFSIAYLQRIVARAQASAVLVGDADVGALAGIDVAVLRLTGPPERREIVASRAPRRGGPAAGGERDLACLIATGGSTGDPRLVARTNASWRYTADNFSVGASRFTDPPLKMLLNARLSHSAGQTLLCTALYLGGTLCIPERLDIATSLEDLRRLDPGYLLLTPRVINALVAQHERGRDRPDPTGWLNPGAEVLVTGGAAADAPLIAALRGRGLVVCEVYGTTEVSDVAMTPRDRPRPGWIGPLCRGVEARIAEDGELLVKTPATMVSYFGDDLASRAAFDDEGFYRTGDLGELAPDGWLRVTGRKRDVINTSEGSNVSPAGTEQQLEALPWVRQVILVGDGRPSIAALIVVAGAPAGAGEQGYLDPERHAVLYRRARGDLARLNASLEGPERLRVVGLFAARFPATVYGELGLKAQRHRGVAAEVYATALERIYAAPLHLVPDALAPAPADEVEDSPDLGTLVRRAPAHRAVEFVKAAGRLRLAGDEVFDLAIARPLTAPGAAEALSSAAAAVDHASYPMPHGSDALRTAFAEFYARRYGQTLDPETEILPLSGTKEGIAHLAMAVADRGRPVYLPELCFPAHRNAALIARAPVVELPVGREDGQPAEIELPGRGGVLFVSSPGNPTAAVLSRETLERLHAATRRRGAVLCLDAAYAETAGTQTVSLAIPTCGTEGVVELHTMSKSFGVPSWRVGFAVGDAAILEKVAAIKAIVDVGVPTVFQQAATALLRSSDAFLAEARGAYAAQHRRLRGTLEGLPIRFVASDAALFAWGEVAGDGAALAAACLERGVFVVPGSMFGAAGRSFIRMSVTIDERALPELRRRLQAVLGDR